MPAATFDLATLDGVNGFRLNGIDQYSYSGRSVSSAGDVNGDGFDDIIIGAPGAGQGALLEAGESYVVFGKASGFSTALDLSTLDGTNGFRLDGIAFSDFSGRSVSSAGDVNGDGFDDIIIGAPYGRHGGPLLFVGESYVVFGKASGFSTVLDLATLDGANGFRLDGIDSGDKSGFSVSSAGDVNGDGFDDIIIGALGADTYTGESYVVFGKASGFSAALDLSTLDGTNGFRLDGIDVLDRSGNSVSSAGDVNGDGFDDIIIGAERADPGGDSYAGESYVVFGKANGFSAALDLSTLDGMNGFRLDGIDPGDASGFSVSSAGDVNNDGFDDIVIGAYRGDPGSNTDAGESYVVFGKASGFSAALDLATLNGANGFRIDGIDPSDYSANSVSSAGDVNGDGFDDLVIGAVGGDPGGVNSAGESYVVFGKASGFSAALDLSTLDGSNGFRIDGIDPSDFSGRSVSSAGDINDDGFDDLIIGTPSPDSSVGESYVVFGFGAAQAFSFDTIAAGSGILSGFTHSVDTLSITGSASSVTITEASGIVTISQNPNIMVGGIGAHQFTSTNLLASDGSQFIIGDDNSSTSRSGDNIAFLYDNTASLTNDLIMGFGGNDTIMGGAGNERLMGGADTDSISGGIGNDTLDGGAGADILDGGSGTNTASYASSSVGVFATQNFNSFNNGDAAGDSFISIENMLGSSFNDILGGNDGDNDVQGALGDDWLFGFLGTDTLVGGSGDDTLNGGAAADSLDGGLGADFASYKVLGTAGINASLANPGSNTGDAVGDIYISIEGLKGTRFNDVLEGDGADNALLGHNGNDMLSGLDGNDSLLGGKGADTLVGGIGNDTLGGQTGDDVLLGYRNNDLLRGWDGADSLVGGRGQDTLIGGVGADTLSGNGGDDTFVYNLGDGADTINGFVVGALSHDVLSLRLGAAFDTFAEVQAAASQVSADTVIDFGGGDTITLLGVTAANLHADDFVFA